MSQPTLHRITPERFYVTGGTLPVSARSYAERSADNELFEALLGGEFCYLLDTRQMGKSSLMARTAQRLRSDGCTVAVLDLTRFGANLAAEQWYDAQINALGQVLDLEDEFDIFVSRHQGLGGLDKWMRVIEEVVLTRTSQRVIIFVDEIDYVRVLPFPTDEYFAGIRQFYNQRPLEPAFQRLTFCLLGVSTPNDLIRAADVTPFNLGQRIEMADFTRKECEVFEQGLGVDTERAKRLIDDVFRWTNGHPFLTQTICDSMVRNPDRNPDDICKELFFSAGAREQNNNLRFVANRLLPPGVDKNAVLFLYERILRGDWIDLKMTDDAQADLLEHLRLSGVAKIADGRYRVRNEIYRRVFDQEWIDANRGDQESRRLKQAAATARRRTMAYAAIALLVLGSITIAGILWRQARQRDQALQIQTKYSKAMEDKNKQLTAAQKDTELERNEAELQRNEADEQRFRAEQAADEAVNKTRLAQAETLRANAEYERANEAAREAAENAKELARNVAISESLRREADIARLDAVKSLAVAKEEKRSAEEARNDAAISAMLVRAALLRDTEPSKTDLAALLSIQVSKKAPTLDGYVTTKSFLDMLPARLDQLTFPGSGAIRAVAFSSNRTKMAVVTDGGLDLVDWGLRPSTKHLSGQLGGARVVQIAVGDSGHVATLMGEGNTNVLSAARDGVSQSQLGQPVAWSPDACLLAVAGSPNKVIDYCLAGRQINRGIPSGTPVAFAPGGELMVCNGTNCVVWNPKNGKSTAGPNNCTQGYFVSDNHIYCPSRSANRLDGQLYNRTTYKPVMEPMTPLSSRPSAKKFAVIESVTGIQVKELRPEIRRVEKASKVPVVGALLARVITEQVPRPVSQFPLPPDFSQLSLNQDASLVAISGKEAIRFYKVDSKEEVGRLPLANSLFVESDSGRPAPPSSPGFTGISFWLDGSRFAYVDTDRKIGVFDASPKVHERRFLVNPSTLTAAGPSSFRAASLGLPLDSFMGTMDLVRAGSAREPIVKAIGSNGPNTVFVIENRANLSPQQRSSAGTQPKGNRGESQQQRSFTVLVTPPGSSTGPITFEGIKSDAVPQAAVSADGSQVAISLDRKLYLQPIRGIGSMPDWPDSPAPITGVAFHRGGPVLAIGERQVQVFRLANPQTPCGTYAAPSKIARIEASPDGDHLLVQTSTTQLLLGPNLCTDKPIVRELGLKGAMHFSPKGTYLVSDDLFVYNVANRDLFSVPFTARAWTIDPEESALAAATPDDVVIFSLKEKKQKGRVPLRAVRVAFGSDGHYLAVLPRTGDLEIHPWRIDDIVTELCNRIARPKTLTREEADIYAKGVPDATKSYCDDTAFKAAR